MDARGLVRVLDVAGTVQGARSLWAAWRRRRSDAAALPRRRPERARVPGALLSTAPQPGGGVLRFARATLLVRVTTGGAVFCGWEGGAPQPSYALVGTGPEADERTELEPDTEGGWRLVSERVTVTISRLGTVEFHTPGGVLLRRDLPPRWWEPVEARDEAGEPGGGPPSERRWMQRSQVPPDARFFGLGAQGRLHDGSYHLWNAGPGPFQAGQHPLLAMPLQLVVADAGTHLAFHDNTWEGLVTLRHGREGAGSGLDRLGRCALRVSGGPLRYWVLTGTPARVLHGWVTLTGAPAVPPRWALGHQHAHRGALGEEAVRSLVDGYRERGLPLRALHLDAGVPVALHGRTATARHPAKGERAAGTERAVDTGEFAAELRTAGVHLVSRVDPVVRVRPGRQVYDSGLSADVFVRDFGTQQVRLAVRSGEVVLPDFTDPRIRLWWTERYTERLLASGCSGVWHDLGEPVPASFGEPALPRSARHALEGHGGDHREAHNVYPLTMNQAGYQALRGAHPAQRPFLLARSGWVGMQRYGGLWSSDPEPSWAGLRAAVAQVVGTGLCGVPYAGPDVGGCGGSLTPELYLRWFQLGGYLPLFRTHTVSPGGRREPWAFGPEVLEHATAVLRERERLLPYLLTLAQLARRTGAPWVRPLWWHAPKDRELRDCDDAFLLGDALLVAPVLEPGATRRTLRLPRGRWYESGTGAVHRGPGRVTLDAPLSRLPVLVRAGTVLPVTGSGGRTELEVWAPPQGRTGGGLLVPDAGDGWERTEVERFTVRQLGGAFVVTQDGDVEVGYPVRVRGIGA